MPHGIKGSSPPCRFPDCPEPSVSNGYCNRHHTSWRKRGSGRPLEEDRTYLARCHGTDEQRFHWRTDKAGPVPSYAPHLGPCWIWFAYIGSAGYPSMGSGDPPKPISIHRWSYEHFVGPIPPGYTVDHLCMVKACVRPDHLEAVTPQENTRRAWQAKTHCKHGHEFTPENTYWRPTGGRSCLECKKRIQLVQNEKDKARRRSLRR